MLIENINKDYKNHFISMDIYHSLTHVTVSGYGMYDDYIYNVKHVDYSIDEILETVYQFIDNYELNKTKLGGRN
jgi:hypothetical protein|tara:strand:+ start:471 stop:692 length:222 start_codon:yes stop_codon:yes gene_type:complete